MKQRFKKAAHKGFKHIALWAVTLAVVATLLFVGLLVRLNYKPIDLSGYLPALEEVLHTSSVGGVELDNLTLSFDGDLNLIGNGVLFTAPDNSPVASALNLKLSIALRSLFFAEIGFKKVELNGLALRVKQGEEYIRIGEYLVERGANKPKPENTKPFSVINALSQIDDISYLRYLEVLEIKNTMVSLTLADEHFDVWNFSETDLTFIRQDDTGEKLTLTGLMQPSQESEVPFYTTFEHRKGEDTAYVTTRFESLHSRLFTSLLPEEQRSLINAEIKTLEVSATLDNENTFKEVDIEANIGKGELSLPDVYSEVKSFRSAVAELELEPRPEHMDININNLVIDSADDLIITGEGHLQLPKEGGNIYANIVLRLMSAPLNTVMTILPDNKMSQAMAWMRDRLNYEDIMINDLRAQLTGHIKDFPFETSENQTPDSLFKVNFGFSGLNVLMLEGLPRLEDANGEVELLSDTVTLTSAEGGMVADQQAKNIKAVISGLFEKDKTNLTIQTDLEGQAQGALNIIFDKVGIQDRLVENAEGTHKTTIEVTTPLTDDPEQTHYTATTELQSVALQLPFLDKPFRAETLTVKTTDKDMKMFGRGEVSPYEDAWWPVEFEWQEQLSTFGDHTQMAGMLQTIDTPMPQLFPKLGLSVTGPLDHDFTFKRTGKGAPFDIVIKSDLEAAELRSASFDWSKEANVPGSFEVLAQMAEDNSYIDLQNMVLRAPGAEVMGAFYTKIDEEGQLSDMSFGFDPFIIGATNAAITYRDQNYSLIGKSFNFSKIGSGELNSDMPIEDGKYTIDIKRLTFKGGKFENVLGYITRTDNTWESFDFKALVGENLNPLTVQLLEAEEGSGRKRRFEVISGDAGAALKALGVYENLSEGRLEAILNINHEYSAFGFDGDGYVLIEDAYLKNAPVMARLLSLVSLQQILKADKGIAFDKIRLPLLMDNRVLRVTKGRLKGPNIGMNLKGYVDFENNYIKFNGALIPATAVNTVVNNIPLLGPILTGSQGAIVAADFSVKGPLDKPDVSANPLSLVTPGLIKDIWDGLSGGDE